MSDQDLDHWEIIARTQEKLKANGFDGLFYPGECACELSDLAPCGNSDGDGDGEYINGCEAGYKHLDPRPEHAKFGDWAMSKKKEPLTPEEWDNISYG